MSPVASGQGQEVAWWERVVPPPGPEPVDVVACDVPADVLFASGSSAVSDAGRAKILALAPALAAAASVEVDGNTDATPRRGTPDEPDGNFALSRDRANSVAAVLEDAGIRAAVILTRGYGSTRPEKDETHGDTSQRAEARQANRRVQVRATFPVGVAPPQLCPPP